jgi:type II secretory pathway component PulF
MSLMSSARFYRQLSLVHRAGIQLSQAVDMAGRVSGGHHGRASKAWSAGCGRGAALAEQMESTAEPSMAVALVRAGERSGRLPEIATALADYYDHLIQLRTLIISKLWYPVVLTHAALTIPALPGIIGGGKGLWTLVVGPALLWTAVGALVMFYLFSRKSGLLGRLMMLPPLSFLVVPLLEVNTYRVLRLAYAAGLLTPDALELAAGGCGARVMGERLTAAAFEVRHGGLPDLTAALKRCGFPEVGVGLIANGELAGKTEETLRQAEILAQDRFDTRTLWTARFVTGFITMVAMLVAAWQIISMWSGYINGVSDAVRESEQ